MQNELWRRKDRGASVTARQSLIGMVSAETIFVSVWRGRSLFEPAGMAAFSVHTAPSARLTLHWPPGTASQESKLTSGGAGKSLAHLQICGLVQRARESEIVG